MIPFKSIFFEMYLTWKKIIDLKNANYFTVFDELHNYIIIISENCQPMLFQIYDMCLYLHFK